MQDSIPEFLGRPIELLYYNEYEPATADHSGGEFMTSESDSENEASLMSVGLLDLVHPVVVAPAPPVLWTSHTTSKTTPC